MTTQTPKPVFNYPAHPPAALTVAQLDGLMTWVMQCNALVAWAAVAWMGIKIALITAYLVARRELIAQESARAKQQYEQDTAHDGQEAANQPIPG